eukprot:TRINITY_DN8665_c1_g1_i3.p2 TRINITY_DN8665_c1_g1~~TRINITY_DN8665_c1_g1_i3.p2  ORF type:complete len:175 (+),score=46.94 TRINITY_DN8665_c1_g1_i3:57-581(+)
MCRAQIPGAIRYLDVSYSGRVWGIGTDGNIYSRSGIEGDWRQEPSANNQFTYLRVQPGYSERVWAITTQNSIATKVYGEPDWTAVDGRLKYIDVDQTGVAWGIGTDNSVFRRDGVAGTWQFIQGRQLTALRATPYGVVYGVDNQGTLVRVNSGGLTSLSADAPTPTLRLWGADR